MNHAQTVVFRREAMSVPSFIYSPSAAPLGCCDLEYAIRQLSLGLNSAETLASVTSKYLRLNPDRAAALYHRLSSVWMSRRGTGPIHDARDCIAELESYRRAVEPLFRAMQTRSLGSFRAALRLLCASHTDSPAADFRTRDVWLSQDSDGTSVVFPDASCIDQQIENTFEVIINSKLPAIPTGIVASTLILNAHPFSDGNGRCARSVLNAVINHRSDKTCFYLPLRLFIEAASGGFELSTREVEIRDSWLSLRSFYRASIHIALDALNDVADFPRLPLNGEA